MVGGTTDEKGKSGEEAGEEGEEDGEKMTKIAQAHHQLLAKVLRMVDTRQQGAEEGCEIEPGEVGI